MSSRRRVLVVRLLIVVIGTLVMIATLVELQARLPVWREQCAIANLVKAGAGIQLFDGGSATAYYSISLAGCENSESNDELLRYVSDIPDVKALTLAPLPIHEAGMASLFRLKSLAMLGVCVSDTGVSRETYAELKSKMKLLNPNMNVQGIDIDGEAVE